MPHLNHEVVEYWFTDSYNIRIGHLISADGQSFDGYYVVERCHFDGEAGTWHVMFNPAVEDDARFETFEDAITFVATIEE
jgi:hypothetical protein